MTRLYTTIYSDGSTGYKDKSAPLWYIPAAANLGEFPWVYALSYGLDIDYSQAVFQLANAPAPTDGAANENGIEAAQVYAALLP